ncbi:hypothetical protein [Paraglaciecola sp. 25GB23A]|uniref:hypothetical protein n=1 Tax=Paraglaciecola sp. 25GB23A TaxID=3156068 RepID=UPI0032AEA097
MNLTLDRLPDAKDFKPESTAEIEQSTAIKPVIFMVMDLLGVVFIFWGLGEQFERLDWLPASLNINHIGLIMILIGFLLTLPFLAWVLKSASKLLNRISI